MQNPATPWGPYPWDNPGQQPTPSPDDLPPPAAAAAPNAALQARALSQQEQQAIVESIGGHQGWFVIGGGAVPETKLGTGLGGRSINVPTGSYTISISDGRGHTETGILITPSGPPDEQGNQGWVASKTPTEPPKDQTHPNVTDQATGTTYVWNDNKAGGPGYEPAPGLPQGQPKPVEGATRAAIESGKNVQQTYSGGEWKTTAILPGSAIPGAAVEGNEQDIVEGGRYVHQRFSDGKWNTVSVGDSAIPGAPKPGDKRPSVENGRNVQQTYDGTAWRTTSVGDSAIPGAAVKGDTRDVIDNGRSVTQTFDGTNWNTTSLGNLATPGAAKPGDTRPSVENGRNVTQTFDGTTWRTTGIGANAMPGAANEGDTRPNVQGGFTIQEVYRNGQWIPDTSVKPVRFTPTEPTVVSAPATQLNIATMQNGQISQQPNANFMPTSTTEVAARVAQLQGAAQQQRDALVAQQQSGAITADQAAQQFDAWWAQTVEPQKAVLDAAQRSAQTAEQQKTSEQNRANYATAQAAGQNAVQAQQALLPYMVGPGFGAALNNIQSAYASGKAPGNIDIGSAVTFQLPDMQALAQQATNQALAHISPMAAQNLNQATGTAAQPQMGQQMNPVASQGMDLGQALNRQNYRPSVTVMPDGTVHINQNNTSPPPAVPQPQPGPASPLPGQNYGPSMGYTGGVSPWNAQPGPAIPNYRPLSAALAPGEGLS